MTLYPRQLASPLDNFLFQCVEPPSAAGLFFCLRLGGVGGSLVLGESAWDFPGGGDMRGGARRVLLLSLNKGKWMQASQIPMSLCRQTRT